MPSQLSPAADAGAAAAAGAPAAAPTAAPGAEPEAFMGIRRPRPKRATVADTFLARRGAGPPSETSAAERDAPDGTLVREDRLCGAQPAIAPGVAAAACAAGPPGGPAPSAGQDAPAEFELCAEDGGGTAGDGPDFELWVETELQADWCLESGGGGGGADPGADKGASHWRATCLTASIRRRWDDFEALGGRSSNPQSGDISSAEAFEALGLLESATTAELAASFRRLSREHHPDKVGSSGAFNALTAAHEVAKRFVAETERRRAAPTAWRAH